MNKGMYASNCKPYLFRCRCQKRAQHSLGSERGTDVHRNADFERGVIGPRGLVLVRRLEAHTALRGRSGIDGRSRTCNRSFRKAGTWHNFGHRCLRSRNLSVSNPPLQLLSLGEGAQFAQH